MKNFIYLLFTFLFFTSCQTKNTINESITGTYTVVSFENNMVLKPSQKMMDNAKTKLIHSTFTFKTDSSIVIKNKGSKVEGRYSVNMQKKTLKLDIPGIEKIKFDTFDIDTLQNDTLKLTFDLSVLGSISLLLVK